MMFYGSEALLFRNSGYICLKWLQYASIMIERLFRSRLLFLLAINLLCVNVSQAQLSRLYTSDNGLSNSQINQIYQDGKGFIWIATEDGLNQFDGTRFTVYRHQPDDEHSLSSNFVHTVLLALVIETPNTEALRMTAIVVHQP